MRKLILVVSVFLSSALSYAHDGNDRWVTANGYSLWSNTYGGRQIRLVPNDGVYNPQGCSDPDSYMVSTAHPEEVQQRIYSTLLTAKLVGSKVGLNIDSNGCEGSKPRILSVVLP